MSIEKTESRLHAARILLVEDDPHIRRFVRTALEAEQWLVFEAESAQRALIEAGTRQPSLLVVDLGLPDQDGIVLIQELRAWSTAPILVLSARDREEDKVSALNAGADDYLVKPFGIPELLARVRAQLRRAALNAANEASAQVQFGTIRVDLARREVHKGDTLLHLTPIEYRLLAALIKSHGKVLTHRQLLIEVWGPGYEARSHYLRIHMGNLRQKLEDQPAKPEFLRTELGVGYRLCGVV